MVAVITLAILFFQTLYCLDRPVSIFGIAPLNSVQFEKLQTFGTPSFKYNSYCKLHSLPTDYLSVIFHDVHV